MLNLDAHEQEVDLAHDNILQVVSATRRRIRTGAESSEEQISLRLVVLELDVQAVLNSDLHLDRVVRVWWHAERVHPDVLLLDDVGHPSRDGHSDEVSV